MTVSRSELRAAALRGVAAGLRFAGCDLNDENLQRTPERFLRYVVEATAGEKVDPADVLSVTFPADGYRNMVILDNIPFVSTCSHHLLPFNGVAKVGYVPMERVVGLSKLARLVDCFARRLQLQERMTEQIADAIETHLEAQGVGVVVRAEHTCMTCRGVMKPGAEMVTSALRGCFEQAATRAEFLSL